MTRVPRGLVARWSVVLLILLAPLAAHADGPRVSPTSGNGLEWNPVVASDLKEYRVFLKPSSTQPYNYAAPFAVVPAPGVGQSFSGTMQPAEGQHYAVVRAVDLAGNQSADSNQVAFVFDATVPDAPVIRLILVAESEYEWTEERVRSWSGFLQQMARAACRVS